MIASDDGAFQIFHFIIFIDKGKLQTRSVAPLIPTILSFLDKVNGKKEWLAKLATRASGIHCMQASSDIHPGFEVRGRRYVSRSPKTRILVVTQKA